MTREQFIQLVSDEQEALRGFLLALCCGYKDDADDIAQDASRSDKAVPSFGYPSDQELLLQVRVLPLSHWVQVPKIEGVFPLSYR